MGKPVIMSLWANISMILSLLFIGPAVVLPIKPNFYLIMIFGPFAIIGYSLMTLSTFVRIHVSTTNMGYEDNLKLYLTISSKVKECLFGKGYFVNDKDYI